jgi:hypothetical protein
VIDYYSNAVQIDKTTRSEGRAFLCDTIERHAGASKVRVIDSESPRAEVYTELQCVIGGNQKEKLLWCRGHDIIDGNVNMATVIRGQLPRQRPRRLDDVELKSGRR